MPPAFAARFRSSCRVIGVALIVGAVLIFAVVVWLTPVVADSLSTGTVAALAGLVALSVVALAVTVMTTRRCLDGDRLVVARARRSRRALNVALAAVGAAWLIAAVVLIALAEPVVDGLVPAFMSLLIGVLGLIGYAAGSFFVRPTAATLRKFEEGPVW